MANNGKHMAQNHKRTNAGPALILAGTLLVTGIVARTAIKADEKIDGPRMEGPTIAQASTTQTMDDLLFQIKNNYVTGDADGLTDSGLVFEFFHEQVRGLPAEQQTAIMRELLDDDTLYTRVYEYVQEKKDVPVTDYTTKDVNVDNYYAIINNQEIMSLVDRYCEAYQLNKEVVVGLLASNVNDFNINRTNPFGLNNYWLGGIDSTRTAWNYETNSADNLMVMQNGAKASFESAIRYGCMVLANAYKEANGNTAEAIEKFYAGLGTQMQRNPNMTSADYKDTVLSYIAAYHGGNRVDLSYTFTLSDTFKKEMHEVYGDELSYDEICDLVDTIGAQLSAHLTSNLGRRK